MSRFQVFYPDRIAAHRNYKTTMMPFRLVGHCAGRRTTTTPPRAANILVSCYSERGAIRNDGIVVWSLIPKEKQQRAIASLVTTTTMEEGKRPFEDSHKSYDSFFFSWNSIMATAACAIGLSTAAIAAGAVPGKKSWCEGVASEGEDSSFVYVSSSDPILLPSEKYDDDDDDGGYETTSGVDFVLRPIRPDPTRNWEDEVRDPSSSLHKSIKALGTTMALDPHEMQTLATSYGGGDGGSDVRFESSPSSSSTGSNPPEQPQQRQEQQLLPEHHQQQCSMATPEQRVRSLDTTKLRQGGENNNNNSTVTTRKAYFYQSPQIGSSVHAEKLTLLSGPSSEELGSDVAHLLGVPVSRMDVGHFADGETRVQIQDSVREKHVYIVNSTTSSDSIVELFLMISALRRASAKRITAVIPYFGYARQDESKQREPIAAADMAHMLEVIGVDRVICVDLHNDTIRGFFSPFTPVEHLMPAPVAAAYFHEELARLEAEEQDQCDGNNARTNDDSENNLQQQQHQQQHDSPRVAVVAAHEGQVGRATQFRDVLMRLTGDDNIELAVLTRSRMQAGAKTYEPQLVGEVKGRKCILVDDIINTGTTLVSNVHMLKQEGAGAIYAWATHGVFGEGTQCDATLERIAGLCDLQFLLISNTIATPRQLPFKIRTLNLAPLLAEAIARALVDKSISSLLSLEPLEHVQRYDGDP